MTILGYREDPKKLEDGDYDWYGNLRSYNFRVIEEHKRGTIATAAVMMCHECRAMIKSMGGPGHRCFCVKCYEALKVADFAEGNTHTIVEK